MRIGIVAARLGEVDGVSFEVIKWQSVLRRLGHDVVLCAGGLPPDDPTGTVILEMHLAYPPAVAVSDAAFDLGSDPASVRREIDRIANPLSDALCAWIDAARLDRLVVENCWAIPMHVPLGVALARAVEQTGVPSIGHHHDYWWERERFSTCVVPDVLDAAFPPDLPGVVHVSINSPAANELRRRRGISSTVVPNVFDFDQPHPPDSDARAARLRSELGLTGGDLLVVQPTRVVPRKGIELAIELVARLGRRDAVLLITSPAGDEGHEYLRELRTLAERLGVDMRYEPERFRPDTTDALEAELPEPAHTLADAYLAADLVTYPSRYEGFGNALVESVFFRKPLVVNRYAVYEADIRPLGFRFVELDGAVTDEVVGDVLALLADADRRRSDGEHNFALGRRHFSYETLERSLATLLLVAPRVASGPATNE